MAKNPPVDVQALGQSIWYDNISRNLLQAGEVQRLVDEDGVMGITSNPTIFMKAISGSKDYDTAIGTMLDLSADEIYDQLAIADIQAAADILKPIYDRTDHVDGYVSLEVSPLIAHDTATTLSEAKRLFAEVDRPNVMIKIPATDAGLPAIEEAIHAGLNINITLIFSVENYREVAERYIRGLERRLQAGQHVTDIASVASFFVSRIDTAVDQQLQNNIRAATGRDLDRVRANRELLGKAAIANAKLAYAAFKGLFHGKRFEKLHAAGAMVQRPLWASTSVKNPSYPDTMYIDNLIGAETVNTAPPETIVAFKDHGTVASTLEQDVHEARNVMDKLAEVGIDFDHITHMLQVDGVDAFADSFEKVLEAVAGKREMLRAGVIDRQGGVVGGYEPGIRKLVKRLHEAKANRAIWGKDPEFWRSESHHKDNIRNRLGWLTIVSDGRIDRNRLFDLKEDSRRWSHAVLLGMGGSSLAPEVLKLTFGQQPGFPDFYVLDSTVPASIHMIDRTIDLENTLFIVASKSGTTIESDAFQRYYFNRVAALKGKEKAGEQFIAITDEGTPLAEEAQRNNYRYLFINPSDIGGRYSALSYFGLVPAAIMGLDLDRLFASAERMEQAIQEVIPAQGNPGMWLGALIAYLAKRGLDKMVIISSPQIDSFGNWIEQLVAESTGKEGMGILPVVGATAGMPHDYDDDRQLIYIRLDGETNLDDDIRAFWEAGHPVFTIKLRDAYDLAGEFLRWEFATAVAGHVLGINPFDEPNVTESKNNTRDLLEYYQEHGRFPKETPYFVEDGVELYMTEDMGEMLTKVCDQRNYSAGKLAGLLASHLSFARSGDYIALLAYVDSSSENYRILRESRRRLRHATTRAVTLGFGPRYLHSTGQLHKGGPDNGVFIMITVDDDEDISIPGKPFTFGQLKQAQALGDMQALIKRDLPAVRLHIKGDISKGLSRVLEAIHAQEEKQI